MLTVMKLLFTVMQCFLTEYVFLPTLNINFVLDYYAIFTYNYHVIMLIVTVVMIPNISVLYYCFCYPMCACILACVAYLISFCLTATYSERCEQLHIGDV